MTRRSRVAGRLWQPFTGAGAATLVVMQVFPPTDPIWSHIAYTIVIPAFWLSALLDTALGRAIGTRWTDSDSQKLRAGFVSLVVAVLFIYLGLVYRVRPVAPEALARQLPDRPNTVQTSALPVMSVDDSLTITFPVEAGLRLPDAAMAARVTVLERQLREMTAKLDAATAQRDEVTTQRDESTRSVTAPKPLPPVTFTLNAETDASCAQIGSGTDPVVDGQRDFLNRIARNRQDFGELLRRLVAATRGGFGNPDSETNIASALDGWNNNVQNQVEIAFGQLASLDFKNTAESDDLLTDSNLAGVTFGDRAKAVLRRATASLQCVQAIEANLQARLKAQ